MSLASPTSLSGYIRADQNTLRNLPCPGARVSECDDAIGFFQGCRAFQDLIDRAMLQGSHSQVDGDAPEDIPGDLLEDEVAQLLADEHELVDSCAPEVSGLEACRTAEPAMEPKITVLFGIQLERSDRILVGRV